MNQNKNLLWTPAEKKIVLNLANKLPAKEIAKHLHTLGYSLRSADAVRGIIRRNPASHEPTFLDPDETRTRILYFDIETTDLSASFGEMISFGGWWHDEPEPFGINIFDYEGWDELPVEQRDYYMLQDVIEILEEANVLVGHYSTRFDFPFIQTRCMMHEMGPVPTVAHIDTWRIARYQLKMNSNKLKTIAEALNCEEQKSKVPAHIWRRAKAHDLKSLEMIADYNIQDVRTQRSVTEKLMPLAKDLPNWSLLSDLEGPVCPACGSTNLHCRGFSYTKLFKYQRRKCNDCGKWMRDRTTMTPKQKVRFSY